MGRGRQKAKHTKVARQLKYFSPDTNLSQLERELSAKSENHSVSDEWADYADQYNTDDSDKDDD